MVRAIGFGAALLCVLCLPASADNPMAAAHAFDDGIQAIRAQLHEGKCTDGLAALQALLEAHKERNHAKARRDEIEDLMRRLACGVELKRPRARDLVSGKLESWSSKTGKLRIKYTPKTQDDLEKRKGFVYFPPRLNGPFKFEIKGTSYPKDAAKEPQVTLGGDQHPKTGKNQSWRIQFGIPPKKKAKAKQVPTIVHIDGVEEKKASQKKSVPGKVGKAYRLIVKATKNKISVTVNGRSIGSVKKPEGVFGYLGFRAATWKEAKLTGSVDPSWLQSQIDEVVAGQLEQFDKTYDKDKYLPEWLYDPLLREDKPKTKEVDLLARLSTKHYDATLEVENAIRAEEFDDALKGIDKMQSIGVPEATCEYLRAKTREHMTDLEVSLKHIRRCLELEPAFLDGALMLGSLLRQMGRHDLALEAFRDMAERHAQTPRTYEAAAESMLSAGRPEDAKQITQMAARNGVTSSDLRKLNRALAKAVNGPRWRKRYQHKSRNYHVMSDMSQSMCREAAESLEASFDAVRKQMGWVPRDTTRLFKVYVFKDKPGFMQYQADLSDFMGKPTTKAAGLYTPALKQLLIWNHSSHEEILNTIRHEGFHQYLDRLMPGPPVWLNEGLAVYYENPVTEDGKLKFGQMHPYYIRLLQRRGFRPLKKFLYGSPFLFYEDGSRSYGQAWALMHMLQHTTPVYAKLYKDLVSSLQTEMGYVVTKRLFPPALITKLESDLKDYVDELAGK